MISNRTSQYKVSVGITTRNRPQLLRQALASVFQQTLRPLQVLVVDDASEPPLEPVPAPADVSLRWWRNETNLGLVAARNDLMAQARGEYFVSLDDDAYFTTPEDLTNAANYLDSHQDIAVLSFRLLKPADTPLTFAEGNCYNPKPMFTYQGGAHMLRLSILDQIGNYRELFFRQSEENDLSYRLWDSGHQIINFPQVQVVHDHPFETQSQSQVNVVYFAARNNLLIIWLNHPWIWQLFSIPNFIVRAVIFYSRHHRLITPFLKGCINAFHEIPYVIKHRRPVSYRTMFRYTRISWARSMDKK